GAGATGSGIQKIYVLIMSSNPAPSQPTIYLNGTATQTWVSWDGVSAWSAPGTLNWLTTGLSGNPQLEFTSKVLFRSISISSTTGDIKIPDWVDGKEYFIAVVSTDALAQVGTSETTTSTGTWNDALPKPSDGFRFIYDVSTPTLTAFAGIVSLSTATDLVDSDTHTWLSSVLSSGTITDNVASLIDPRLVFMRVYDMDALKYLNPNTLISFNISNANSAWAQVSIATNIWNFDLSQAQFINGSRYKIEIYGQDGAGNFDTAGNCAVAVPFTSPVCLTGSAATPKYVRYFKFNKALPLAYINSPSLTPPNNVGGANTLDTISGTAISVGGSVINRVEYYLTYSDLSKRWDAVSNSWITTTPGDLWSPATYYLATTTWGVQGVSWVQSQSYIFSVRSVDAAGNTSNAASLSFNYDIAAPVSVVTSRRASVAICLTASAFRP
ncbi:MAG: hypothetical protein AAB217_15195, partial [Chloroflexota bacterium]